MSNKIRTKRQDLVESYEVDSLFVQLDTQKKFEKKCYHQKLDQFDLISPKCSTEVFLKLKHPL